MTGLTAITNEPYDGLIWPILIKVDGAIIDQE